MKKVTMLFVLIVIGSCLIFSEENIGNTDSNPSGQEISLSPQEANKELNKLLTKQSPQEQWNIINNNLNLAKKAWGDSFDYNYWTYECWKTGKYIEERPEPKKETGAQIDRNKYLDKNSFWYESDYRKSTDLLNKIHHIENQMVSWSNIKFVSKKQKTTQKNCSFGYKFWRNEYFVITEMAITAGYSFQINNLLVDSCDKKWQEIASAYDTFISSGMTFEEYVLTRT